MINERNRTLIKMDKKVPCNTRSGRPVDPSKEVAILDAATELLFAQGPAKFSIEAVARKAGVSKVTVYNRFSEKNALIEACIHRQCDSLLQHLVIDPEQIQTPQQALYDFAVNLTHFILSHEHLNFLRLLGSLHEVDRDLLHSMYNNSVQNGLNTLSGWLKTQHEAGFIDCADTERAAELFLSMLAGLDIVRALHQLPPRQPGEEINRHVESVVKQCWKLWERNK
ncbi:TetR/AcrR family transcriptional regulator [Nitrincola sp. A-D6]|uniref:TetR/AcrR family transcriptional regulator n=1 Tax=Nitrincola sp. A-D6 TaxID=1545442 RepID=UPI00068DAD6C|nr:TetR/AcrR family transcriptional regulator [Nitrincola sp. A-D6]